MCRHSLTRPLTSRTRSWWASLQATSNNERRTALKALHDGEEAKIEAEEDLSVLEHEEPELDDDLSRSGGPAQQLEVVCEQDVGEQIGEARPSENDGSFKAVQVMKIVGEDVF